MDGGSLQDIVSRGGCGSERVLSSIARQVLRGLRSLHEDNQVHRDIKPANLLINYKGDVKLADFGVTRVIKSVAKTNTKEIGDRVGEAADQLPEGPRTTLAAAGEESMGRSDRYHPDDRASTFIGTVSYMSPERIKAGTYAYSSDIWSLGLSLMTIATGEFPYGKSLGSYFDLLDAIATQDVPMLQPRHQSKLREKQQASVCPHGSAVCEGTGTGASTGAGTGAGTDADTGADTGADTDTVPWSADFVSFIAAAMEKDPSKRASAQTLLSHPFIKHHNTAPVGNQASSLTQMEIAKVLRSGSSGGGPLLDKSSKFAQLDQIIAKLCAHLKKEKETHGNYKSIMQHWQGGQLKLHHIVGLAEQLYMSEETVMKKLSQALPSECTGATSSVSVAM